MAQVWRTRPWRKTVENGTFPVNSMPIMIMRATYTAHHTSIQDTAIHAAAQHGHLSRSKHEAEALLPSLAGLKDPYRTQACVALKWLRFRFAGQREQRGRTQKNRMSWPVSMTLVG